MILIGLGANLTSPEFGSPRQTLLAAIDAMAAGGIGVNRLSPWYESAPVPASDQPWYVNAVAEVETDLEPVPLLGALQAIEAALGRVRTIRNAPRIVDLDIIDYDGRVIAEERLRVPHPRMRERAFVLLPLRDLAPDWRHPVSRESVEAMIDQLPPGQETRCLAGD